MRVYHITQNTGDFFSLRGKTKLKEKKMAGKHHFNRHLDSTNEVDLFLTVR